MEKPDSKDKEPSQRLFAKENVIKTSNGQSWAWVVDKGKNIALHRSVTLGASKQDGWVEVTQGLQPGDALIDGDTGHFQDGQRIKLEEDAPLVEPVIKPPEEHKHSM